MTYAEHRTEYKKVRIAALVTVLVAVAFGSFGAKLITESIENQDAQMAMLEEMLQFEESFNN